MIIVIQLLLFIKSTECVYLVNMAVYRPCNNKSIYLKNTKCYISNKDVQGNINTIIM